VGREQRGEPFSGEALGAVIAHALIHEIGHHFGCPTTTWRRSRQMLAERRCDSSCGVFGRKSWHGPTHHIEEWLRRGRRFGQNRAVAELAALAQSVPISWRGRGDAVCSTPGSIGLSDIVPVHPKETPSMLAYPVFTHTPKM
jgi:hypothetical protein